MSFDACVVRSYLNANQAAGLCSHAECIRKRRAGPARSLLPTLGRSANERRPMSPVRCATAIGTLAVAFAARAALGCSCELTSAEELFRRVDAVVEGTVTDVNHGYLRLAWCQARSLVDDVCGSDFMNMNRYDDECGLRVSLAVTHSWKGSAGESLRIITGRGGGDCGFPFEEAKSYLLYLREATPGVFYTSICMRPHAIEDASEDRQVLTGLTGKQASP